MAYLKLHPWIRTIRRILRLILYLSEMGQLCLILRIAYNKFIYNARMKGKDFQNVIWHSCTYHCGRISRNFFSFTGETVVVKIQQGFLRGRKMTSVLGKSYYRFQGVPYAKPPIGRLRFKDPEPPDAWNGIRDALKEGDICIHKDVITGIVKGTENCLFLNVFTPQLAQKNTPGRAVMFWIHGGGFQLGSGNAEIYSPDYLLGENVVVVTMNYRLGALGFLSTGTRDAPGNAGLKDMVMALRWVKENIAVFGGDPNNITIFGESAGGAAVHFLLLSPLAKGLFHKAISQSGSACCPWAFGSEHVDSAFRLGKAFGIDTKDPKVLVENLRKIPARVLATKQNAALSEENKRNGMPIEFRPCPEPENYPNAFITKDPRVLLEQGQIVSDVPYITGVNEMEGMILLKAVVDKKPSSSVIDQDFERVVPKFLNLSYGSKQSKEAADRLREYYLKGKRFSKKTFKEYVHLTSDTQFIESVSVTTRAHLKHLKSPVYNYLFLFEGKSNLFKQLLNVGKISGPAHSDELFYLFHTPILGPDLDPKKREMIMSKRIARLWANFAKFGDPTPDSSDKLLQNVVWPKSNAETNPYLSMNDNLMACTDFMRDRIRFWDDMKERYAPR